MIAWWHFEEMYGLTCSLCSEFLRTGRLFQYRFQYRFRWWVRWWVQYRWWGLILNECLYLFESLSVTEMSYYLARIIHLCLATCRVISSSLEVKTDTDESTDEDSRNVLSSPDEAFDCLCDGKPSCGVSFYCFSWSDIRQFGLSPLRRYTGIDMFLVLSVDFICGWFSVGDSRIYVLEIDRFGHIYQDIWWEHP